MILSSVQRIPGFYIQSRKTYKKKWKTGEINHHKVNTPTPDQYTLQIKELRSENRYQTTFEQSRLELGKFR